MSLDYGQWPGYPSTDSEAGTNRPNVAVHVLLEGWDISRYVLFDECYFEQHAFAQPGQFQIVIRADETMNVHPGRRVEVLIDDEISFTGKVLTVEWTNFFPAGDGKGDAHKIILTGYDYNIYFDKIFVYDKEWKTGTIEGKAELPWIKAGTTDQEIILKYINQYMDKPDDITADEETVLVVSSPFGEPNAEFMDDGGQSTTGDGVGLATGTGTPTAGGDAPAPVDASGDDALVFLDQPSGGVIASVGASWRAVMEEVANNLYSKYKTTNSEGEEVTVYAFDAGFRQAAYWYIDARRCVRYGPMETFTAPFAVGAEDTENNVVGVREFEISTDISAIKTEAIVYGLLGTPVKFYKEMNEKNYNTYGRWQAAEIMYDAANIGAVVAHGQQMLKSGGNPAKTARFAIFKPGLVAGQILSVLLPGWDEEERVPIRSIRMSFPTPWNVRYDVECAIETTAPWRYWFALSREPRRGMQQPPYTNVLDESEVTPEDKMVIRKGTKVTGGRFILHKDAKDSTTDALKKGIFQTRFAYKHFSLIVWLNGKKLTSGIDYVEQSGKTKYYLAGQIKLDPSISQKLTKTDKLTCEYSFLQKLPKGVSYSPTSGGTLY